MRTRLRFLYEGLTRRAGLEEEMDAELRAHIERYTEDLIRSGVSKPEAERRAHLEFGALDAVKEECREAHGLRCLDELRQNLRYAFRGLRNAPGFAAAAVLSLALGIGANTAIFSVLHASLLRPLPYTEPERLVAVYEHQTTLGNRFEEFSNANFADLRAASSCFRGLGAHMPRALTFSDGKEAERLDGRIVTANLFSILGVRAQLGRILMSGDDDLSRPPVILLSDSLWRRKFAGDTGVIGRPVWLEGSAYAVTGVMPPDFRFPGSHDEFWIPFRLNAAALQERSNHNLQCIGRLKPATDLRQGQAQASTIARRLRRDYPDLNPDLDFNIVPLREALTRTVRTPLIVLLAAAGLLLIVACTNVGNLMLTRSTARRRELALRAALGAGRARLVRQMVTESLLLATVGGMAAMALCVALVHTFRAALPAALLPGGELRVDAAVLEFGLLASLCAGLVCATVPAALVSRKNLQGTLSDWSRSATAPGSDVRMRGVLVAGEVALTVVLLVASGLLLRSFLKMIEVDPGLRAERTLAVRFALPYHAYPSAANRMAFYGRLLESVKALPGVNTAALITSVPFTFEGGSSWFLREGRPSPHPEELIASNRLVTADYFSAAGIPIRAGRVFSKQDGAGTPLVAVINESMARRFWPGENPVGKRFQFIEKPWVEIVGVVGDVHQEGLDAKPVPEIYRPLAQDTQDWLAPRALIVRTEGEPLAAASAVRAQFRTLDRGVPVYGLARLDTMLDKLSASRRLELWLVGAFAVLSLLVASIGIYGVVAYAVAQRRQEIGIRIALGATGSAVLGMMVRRGLAPVAAGLLPGIALAFGLSRYLTAQLYAVQPSDAGTFLAVPVLLIVTAALAAYVPSRRAAATDPMQALRHD